VTWAELCKLGLELPGTEVASSYGTPALKVKGKLLARLKEDGKSVVFFTENLDEKEALLGARPAVYFTTDHYNGYPAVLARLAKLRVGEARTRLERAWFARAPKKLVAARAASET
jgi:hypothetical protein